MKKTMLVSLGLLLCLACRKEEKCLKMTVVRDCTGTYLQLSGKDYHVCNPEKVMSFADHATVCVIFQKITECNGSANEGITCKMAHPNEGWIEVRHIR